MHNMRVGCNLFFYSVLIPWGPAIAWLAGLACGCTPPTSYACRRCCQKSTSCSSPSWLGLSMSAQQQSMLISTYKSPCMRTSAGSATLLASGQNFVPSGTGTTVKQAGQISHWLCGPPCPANAQHSSTACYGMQVEWGSRSLPSESACCLRDGELKSLSDPRQRHLTVSICRPRPSAHPHACWPVCQDQGWGQSGHLYET